MLYGKQKLREHILKTAQTIAQKQGFVLVFGAAINSIGRGTHCYDSDYDIRFLYIRKDFPQKIYYPWKMEENDIKFFYEPETPTPLYHHISFWDITAFLQLLICPELKENTHNKWGLYYIVKKVLFSPYTWDPFGLQMKILPLLELKVYRLDYELCSHLDEIKTRFSTTGEELNIKDYILALYEAFSIEWSLRYRTPSPFNILTLYAGIENKQIVQKAKNLLAQHRSLRISNLNARNTVLIKREKDLDSYIQKTSDDAEAYIKSFKAADNIGDSASDVLSEIYQIIYDSIESPAIKNIND